MSINLCDYEKYAKWLSYNYPYYGSGADEKDVFQIAMISAWEAIRDNQEYDKKFIFRVMKFKVIDFVRIRDIDKQKKFDRKFVNLDFDIIGEDTTLNYVLVRDELQRAVEIVNELPKKQRKYLKSHINGVPRKMIEPNRRVQTIDLAISIARKRVEAALII